MFVVVCFLDINFDVFNGVFSCVFDGINGKYWFICWVGGY